MEDIAEELRSNYGFQVEIIANPVRDSVIRKILPSIGPAGISSSSTKMPVMQQKRQNHKHPHSPGKQ